MFGGGGGGGGDRGGRRRRKMEEEEREEEGGREKRRMGPLWPHNRSKSPDWIQVSKSSLCTHLCQEQSSFL